MTNSNALAFARSPAVVLFGSENDNMWGDWEDYIVATRTKKGIFNVLARNYGDEYLDGKSKKKWFLIHSVGNLRKADTFVEAVRACESSLNVDVYWPDVISSLGRLDPDFSISVANLVDY
jgi:hypothetical protein